MLTVLVTQDTVKYAAQPLLSGTRLHWFSTGSVLSDICFEINWLIVKVAEKMEQQPLMRRQGLISLHRPAAAE